MDSLAVPPLPAKVKWRVLLPAVMFVLSALLILLGRTEEPMIRGRGTGWQVPATVINSLINGPGFFLGRLILMPMPDAMNRAMGQDGDLLAGIVLFWFLVGLSVDRARNRQRLDRKYPIRAGTLFACTALICGVFAWGFASIVQPKLVFGGLGFLIKHPDLLFMSDSGMELGLAIWLVGFCVYFTRRTIAAVRKSFASPRPISLE